MARLRPARRAITDGSPDPVPVDIHLDRRGTSLTVHVDRATARRFARHRWLVVVAVLPILAIILTMGIMYGRNHPLVAENPLRWVMLSIALLLLSVSIQLSYVVPRGYPRASLFGPVRLNNVDDSAAMEWQSTNDTGVITVKPDTPTRDMLVRHVPPVVFGLVVVAVALLA